MADEELRWYRVEPAWATDPSHVSLPKRQRQHARTLRMARAIDVLFHGSSPRLATGEDSVRHPMFEVITEGIDTSLKERASLEEVCARGTGWGRAGEMEYLLRKENAPHLLPLPLIRLPRTTAPGPITLAHRLKEAPPRAIVDNYLASLLAALRPLTNLLCFPCRVPLNRVLVFEGQEGEALYPLCADLAHGAMVTPYFAEVSPDCEVSAVVAGCVRDILDNFAASARDGRYRHLQRMFYVDDDQVEDAIELVQYALDATGEIGPTLYVDSANIARELEWDASLRWSKMLRGLAGGGGRPVRIVANNRRGDARGAYRRFFAGLRQARACIMRERGDRAGDELDDFDLEERILDELSGGVAVSLPEIMS